MGLVRLFFSRIVLPTLVVFLAYWFQPIFKRLPRPILPQAELTDYNQTRLSATESCEIVQDQSSQALKFCEDLVHWKDAHSAIVSCDGGRLEWNTVIGPLKSPHPRGALWAYRLMHNSTHPKETQGLYRLELQGFPPDQQFHPLGIQIFPTGPSTAKLFVVNHRQDKSVIEIFDLEASSGDASGGSHPRIRSAWVRTVSHDLIQTPNSIVALGPRLLLLTNDHYFNRRNHPILHTIETWLALPIGNVIGIEIQEDFGHNGLSKDDDGSTSSHGMAQSSRKEPGSGIRAKKLIGQISFANGIALSPSGHIIAVASSMHQSIKFYHLSNKSNSSSKPDHLDQIQLNYQGIQHLKFTPDNLHFHQNENQLIVAGHPHGLSLAKFVKDPNQFSKPGSWVSVLILKDFEKFMTRQNNNDDHNTINFNSNHFKFDQVKIIDLFKDDGIFFSTSSTALILSNENQTKSLMVISGLYEFGLLRCKI